MTLTTSSSILAKKNTKYPYSKLAAAVLNLAFQEAYYLKPSKNSEKNKGKEKIRLDALSFLTDDLYKEWRESLIALAEIWVKKETPDGSVPRVEVVI